MINCPNCDKQIADDSAHCGYCGHTLEKKEKKKTMFGMAALSGDELKKAVEQAKEAKDEDGASEDAQAQKGGGLKIPKPGQKNGQKSGGAGKEFSIPKPGEDGDEQQAPQEDESAFAKTERIDLSNAEPPSDAQAEPHEPPSDSQTEPHEPPAPQHEFSPGGSGLGSESSATINTSSLGSGDNTPEPAPSAQQNAPAEPNPPAEPTGPSSFGEPVGPGPSQVSQAGAQSGPFGPGAKEAAEAQQAQQAQQQGGIASHQVGKGDYPPVNTEEKSKKKMIIAAIAGLMLLGGGCMAVVGYFVADYFGWI